MKCRYLLFQAVLAAVAVTGAANADEAPQAGWRSVSTIFEKRCIMCHGAQGANLALRLDSYAAAVAGSKNGPVLVAGDPAASEMMRRLLGEKTPRMPFLGRPLPEDEIETIRRWIEAGLPSDGN